MPCYDGHREDERRDRETAKKVEAVLCVRAAERLHRVGRFEGAPVGY